MGFAVVRQAVAIHGLANNLKVHCFSSAFDGLF